MLRLLDDDGGDGGEREIPLPPAPRLSAARLAIRLGQTSRGAGRGRRVLEEGVERERRRRRWDGAAAAARSGGGWSVVSDKGW